MGIDAKLQTEDGKILQEVFDPEDILQQLIPSSDEGSACLRFVDLYSDTTFNRLQIPVLIKELENAIRNSESAEARKHGEKVLELVKKATNETYNYIKFIGD